MVILYFLVGYAALYSVIWLHEVGHGLVYAKYGCKENPLNVHVPFYLFFSTPQPVRLEKVKYLTNKQGFFIGMGGIVVNLLFGLPLGFLLFQTDYESSILLFFMYSFTVFHLVEAASYLTISNIFLASDIVSVQQYKPVLRIPLFIIGLGVIPVVFMLIKHSPEAWRVAFITSIIVMIFCMVGGRFVFMRRQRHSS